MEKLIRDEKNCVEVEKRKRKEKGREGKRKRKHTASEIKHQEKNGDRMGSTSFSDISYFRFGLSHH